jgi:hypothetical protein
MLQIYKVLCENPNFFVFFLKYLPKNHAVRIKSLTNVGKDAGKKKNSVIMLTMGQRPAVIASLCYFFTVSVQVDR